MIHVGLNHILMFWTAICPLAFGAAYSTMASDLDQLHSSHGVCLDAFQFHHPLRRNSMLYQLLHNLHL